MYDFWEGQSVMVDRILRFIFGSLASGREVFLAINSRPIIATMASKFMANPAFKVRLLLDHLTIALLGSSTSLNTPSLADLRYCRLSASVHTQTRLLLL